MPTDNTGETYKTCSEMDSMSAILASREIENWRGLAAQDELRDKNILREIAQNSRTKSGKISKYFDKNQETYDTLRFEHFNKIPIMLNGNSLRLKV